MVDELDYTDNENEIEDLDTDAEEEFQYREPMDFVPWKYALKNPIWVAERKKKGKGKKSNR